MLDRIFEAEHASLRLRLVADVRVLLTHPDHHALVPRPSDRRREDAAGCIVAGEADLEPGRSNLDDDRLHFLEVGRALQ